GLAPLPGDRGAGAGGAPPRAPGVAVLVEPGLQDLEAVAGVARPGGQEARPQPRPRRVVPHLVDDRALALAHLCLLGHVVALEADRAADEGRHPEGRADPAAPPPAAAPALDRREERSHRREAVARLDGEAAAVDPAQPPGDASALA